MLTRLFCRTLVLVLCAVLLLAVRATYAGNLSADQYLSMRKSLSAPSITLTTLKGNLPNYAGKTVELLGKVNGMMTSGDATTFVLECDGDSIVVKAATAPDCIVNGNTVRVLARISPESTISLSDVQLEGAAYDYDISAREKELTPKPKAKPAPKPVAKKRDSNPKTYASSRMGRGDMLSSRAMSVYDPYRKAIARFNPRLTARELDAITASILAYSEKYKIDPRLVIALIIAESGFRPNATSRAGAMGLCQLMPGTARGLGVGNAYDPAQNIEGAVKYLRGQIDRYGSLDLVLSAYNAGPGAVKKHGGVPPYRETRNYIRKVSSLYKALCGE